MWGGVEAGLERRRSRWARRLGLGGLVAAGALGLGLWLFPASDTWDTPRLVSQAPEIAKLRDGSRIALQENTALERCAAEGQCFAVLAGAAEFQVRPQPKPFRVRARHVEVKVVGTRFVVADRAGVVAVEVSEGRVEVSAHGVVVRTLTAGERWSSEEPAPPAEVPPSVDAGVLDGAEDAGLAEEGPADAGATGIKHAAKAPAPGPSADTLWSLAMEAKLADDDRGEAAAYRLFVTRFPSDARAGRASFELARLAMDVQKSPADAVRWLLAALARGPSESYAEDAWARLVRAAAASGDLERCRSARTTYLGRYPRGVHVSAVREACP